MATDWKIELCLYDCDGLYDDMINEDGGVEVNLPSIPSKGDVIWPDNKTLNELTNRARTCWKQKHCEDCPYIYGRKESIKDIDACDYIFVMSKIYDIEKKTIKIGLGDGTKTD